MSNQIEFTLAMITAEKRSHFAIFDAKLLVKLQTRTDHFYLREREVFAMRKEVMKPIDARIEISQVLGDVVVVVIKKPITKLRHAGKTHNQNHKFAKKNAQTSRWVVRSRANTAGRYREGSS